MRTSEVSDQTGQKPRLIRVFAGRTCHNIGFVVMLLTWSRAAAVLQYRIIRDRNTDTELVHSKVYKLTHVSSKESDLPAQLSTLVVFRVNYEEDTTHSTPSKGCTADWSDQMCRLINEPQHDKNHKTTCVPSKDSDQPVHQPSLHCGLNRPAAKDPRFPVRTAKTLIRLDGCPGWSESSLGAQIILLVLSCWGSFDSLQYTYLSVGFALHWLIFVSHLLPRKSDHL